MASQSLPLPISRALGRLESLFSSPNVLYGRPESIRAMRPERQSALVKLFTFFLKTCCLAQDGALLRVIPDIKRGVPVTVEKMVEATGLPRRTINRCLYDAKNLGLLKSGEQIKRTGADGRLEVSPVVRVLTPKFWQSVGLWELYQKSVAYAKGAAIKISLPFRKIGRSVGGLVKKTINSLQGKDWSSVSSKARNAACLAAVECFKKKGTNCVGGGNNPDVCKICRSLVQLK